MSFWDKFRKPAQPAQPEYLRPGTCECGHDRCSHVDGKGKCCAGFPADKEWPDGADCACQIFIRDDDDGPDGAPEAPSPTELEKLYKL